MVKVKRSRDGAASPDRGMCDAKASNEMATYVKGLTKRLTSDADERSVAARARRGSMGPRGPLCRQRLGEFARCADEPAR